MKNFLVILGVLTCALGIMLHIEVKLSGFAFMSVIGIMFGFFVMAMFEEGV